jgi:hypothetical protein
MTAEAADTTVLMMTTPGPPEGEKRHIVNALSIISIAVKNAEKCIDKTTKKVLNQPCLACNELQMTNLGHVFKCSK